MALHGLSGLGGSKDSGSTLWAWALSGGEPGRGVSNNPTRGVGNKAIPQCRYVWTTFLHSFLGLHEVGPRGAVDPGLLDVRGGRS